MGNIKYKFKFVKLTNKMGGKGKGKGGGTLEE